MKDQRRTIEPIRIEYAIHLLTEARIDIHHQDDKCIKFMHKGYQVVLFPFTGWFAGKTVVDGRGIKKLIEQLKHTQS